MTVEVHIEWKSNTVLVGRLYVSDNSSAVTFEYAEAWLEQNDAFSVDPVSLPLGPGKYHSKRLFGAFQDCGPDRWGRLLIQRAVRKGLLPKRPYHDLDYVLQLDDASRIGALRFREEKGGPFLAATDGRLPPVVELAALKRAADAIHSETETANDLKFLLGYGSPLGGARPKSAVHLKGDMLGIAKFPKPDDTRDVAAGEILGLQLAHKAGVEVAGNELVKLEEFSVAVICRFDRDGAKRIPFISAASLLTLPPGELGSYAALADTIRQHGDNIPADLQQLWRRMIFSMLASNCDDHMRNHAFLMRKPGRLALSPAYDINPVPEVDRSFANATPVDEDAGEPSIRVALRAAPRFGLTERQAKTILEEVFLAVSDWKTVAQQLRLRDRTIETYSSAFDHTLTAEAKKFVG